VATEGVVGELLEEELSCGGTSVRPGAEVDDTNVLEGSEAAFARAELSSGGELTVDARDFPRGTKKLVCERRRSVEVVPHSLLLRTHPVRFVLLLLAFVLVLDVEIAAEPVADGDSSRSSSVKCRNKS
jgi:hypothetical protein